MALLRTYRPILIAIILLFMCWGAGSKSSNAATLRADGSPGELYDVGQSAEGTCHQWNESRLKALAPMLVIGQPGSIKECARSGAASHNYEAHCCSFFEKKIHKYLRTAGLQVCQEVMQKQKRGIQATYDYKIDMGKGTAGVPQGMPRHAFKTFLFLGICPLNSELGFPSNCDGVSFGVPPGTPDRTRESPGGQTGYIRIRAQDFGAFITELAWQGSGEPPPELTVHGDVAQRPLSGKIKHVFRSPRARAVLPTIKLIIRQCFAGGPRAARAGSPEGRDELREVQEYMQEAFPGGKGHWGVKEVRPILEGPGTGLPNEGESRYWGAGRALEVVLEFS